MCEIWSVVKIAAINWCCMFIGLSFGAENKRCEKPYTSCSSMYPLRGRPRQFKQLTVDQGFDKLPATHGAWIEHMRRLMSRLIYGTI